MGLSASQGKLLVLTARKSDLEFRAQVIANRKLLLTAQTENIAMEYTRKLGNKKMQFVNNFDSNQNSSIEELFSIDSLYCQNASFIGDWRVVLADGRIAVPDASYLPQGVVYDTNTGYAQSCNATYQPTTAQMLEKFNSLGEGQQLQYLATGLSTLCNDYQNLDATTQAYLNAKVTEAGHNVTEYSELAKNLLDAIYGSSVSRNNDITQVQATNALKNSTNGSELTSLVRNLSKDIFNIDLEAIPSEDEHYAAYTSAINKLNAFSKLNDFLDSFNTTEIAYGSTARALKDGDNYTGFTKEMAEKLTADQKKSIEQYYKNIKGEALTPATEGGTLTAQQYADAMNYLNKFYAENSAKLETKYDLVDKKALSSADVDKLITRLDYLKQISEAYLKEYNEKPEDLKSSDAYDVMKRFLNSNKENAAQLAYNGCGAFRSLFVSGQVIAQTPASDGSQNIIINNGYSTEQYVIIPGLKNTYFFQNALRQGSIYLQQFAASQNDPSVGEWQTKDWSATGLVRDALDTSDDAQAEMEYETQMAIIQGQDKKLDVEMKQVETQQKACENEIDAVKKVIEKNGEKTFKYFS